MARQVYLENWQEQLELTIDTVAKETSIRSSSPEQAALLIELDRLMELARQVRDLPTQDRELVRSALLPWTVKEPLDLPGDLVSRLSELFDIYRRFRTRLMWSN